jgi:hypothetical protein
MHGGWQHMAAILAIDLQSAALTPSRVHTAKDLSKEAVTICLKPVGRGGTTMGQITLVAAIGVVGFA